MRAFISIVFFVSTLIFGNLVMTSTSTSTSSTPSHSSATAASTTIGEGKDTPQFDLEQWQKGPLRGGFEATCFQDYWSTLPSLVDETAASVVVDPYNFHHRMALGKYLMEQLGSTTSCWGDAMSYFGKHWYWAYLAQTDWQHRSGRFQSANAIRQEAQRHGDDMDSRMTAALVSPPYGPKIATDSWWGYMNLGFTVGVYCGAAEAGLVPQIKFSKHKKSLERDANFQKCVQHWKEFFQGPHADFVTQVENKKSLGVRAMAPFYIHLWASHSETVRAGMEGAQKASLLSKLSTEDSEFGRGWCRMVELLAAMQWSHLTLDSLMKYGAGNLPCRPLSPPVLEWLKEHRSWEYESCQNIRKLCEAKDEDLHQMAKFWGRVAGYSWIQSSFPKTLESLSHGNPVAKALTLAKVLFFAALPRTGSERAVWVSIIGMATGLFYLFTSFGEEPDF